MESPTEQKVVTDSGIGLMPLDVYRDCHVGTAFPDCEGYGGTILAVNVVPAVAWLHYLEFLPP